MKSNACASLSVVVVSTGSALTTQRATQVVVSASSGLPAQCIVVSSNHDPALASAVERSGAEFVAAPKGCSRSEMCDLGMSRVIGTIVAVRDDVSVGDAQWLDAYRKLLPPVEVAPVKRVESVVMDTLIPARVALADRSEVQAPLEPVTAADVSPLAAAV